MVTVRLKSTKSEEVERDGKHFLTMGISAPGVIGWAKAGYPGGEKGRRLAIAIAESFGLKQAVAVALLTGEVDYTVDGDDVVFQWPDDPNAEASE